MTIHFGTYVPTGWRREFPTDTDPAGVWGATVDFAVRAEQLGFDSVWVGDHLQSVPVATAHPLLESWSVLIGLSQRTSSVELGHMVSCAPFRNAAVTARMGSTLAAMAPGRFRYGVGAGWLESEFLSYGFEWKSPRERVRVLEETLEIVTRLWDPSVDVVTYEGEHLVAREARADPKPVTRPKILVGGWGEQHALRVVARFADQANFPRDLDNFVTKNAALDRHCEEIGRNPSEIERTTTADLFIRLDEEEIIRGGCRSYAPISMEEWRANSFVGTPQQVIDRIGSFVDAGAGGIILSPADVPDATSIELFAEHVLPEFR